VGNLTCSTAPSNDWLSGYHLLCVTWWRIEQLHRLVWMVFTAVWQSTWATGCCWLRRTRDVLHAGEDTSLGTVESRPSAVYRPRHGVCRWRQDDSGLVKAMSSVLGARKLWVFCSVFRYHGKWTKWLPHFWPVYVLLAFLCNILYYQSLFDLRDWLYILFIYNCQWNMLAIYTQGN